MAVSRSIQVAFAVLVAFALVEAGVLAYVVGVRGSLSADLTAEQQRGDMSAALIASSAELQDELLAIDKASSDGAAELLGSSLNDSHAHDVLRDILNSSSYVANVVTIDRNGTIQAVEPEEYGHLEGMALAEGDPVITPMAEGRPVLTPLFTVLEGYQAVAIGYPILDAEGKVAGAISTLVRPDRMMENITATLGDGVNVMVMQEDGVILYDPDATQIGRNTFTDPRYKDNAEIQAIAAAMVNESHGTGSYYIEQDGTVIHKEVMWTTTGVLGARWTVAVNAAV